MSLTPTKPRPVVAVYSSLIRVSSVFIRGFIFAFCLLALHVPAPAAETDSPKPPAIQTHDVPPVPASFAARLAQYQNIRTASFAGWSPDGKGILIRTRFGNSSQLHRV